MLGYEDYIIQTRKNTWENYKKEFRSFIAREIAKANADNECETCILKKVDDWLIKELEEKGFDVEVFPKMVYADVVTSTRIYWGNEEEI